MAARYRTAEDAQAHADKLDVCRDRKSALKHFQKQYPGTEIQWRAGMLVFAASGEQVPGSPLIHKKKREEPAPIESAPRPPERYADSGWSSRSGAAWL